MKKYGQTISFRVSEALGKQYQALPLVYRKSIAVYLEKMLDKSVQSAIDDLYERRVE
jgi:hypothetical protein